MPPSRLAACSGRTNFTAESFHIGYTDKKLPYWMKHDMVTPNANQHAMIKYRQHGGKTPHIPDLGAEWRWELKFCSACFIQWLCNNVCVCVCMYACTCVFMYVCTCVFMYVFIYVCMYVCMNVCMYVRMYVLNKAISSSDLANKHRDEW
jgi:hypothetical protein